MQWDELKRKFCHIAAARGIRNVADAIPASHTTVYRLIKGETLHPSHAVRAAMTRIVDEDEKRSDVEDTGKE